MPRSHQLPDVPTVFVVDPDPSIAQTTRELLDGSETPCVVFRTGREFLEFDCDNSPGCLILEQRMPDMSGMQLQHRLAAAGSVVPLIFVTANPDVSMAVELMRGGAVHVLEKPVRSVELLEAIHEALEQNRIRRESKLQAKRLKSLTAALTRKELQVLELIAVGKSPKSIASELELSVRAVEMRRNTLMAKLEVRSTTELLRFAVLAQQELGLGANLIPSERPEPRLQRVPVKAR